MLGHSALGEQPLGAFQSTITRIDADAGTFTLTGQAATLEVLTGFLAEAGAFTLTGQSAGLYKTFRVVGDAGAFTLSGQDLDFIRHTLAAGTGSFTFSEQDAGLLRTLLLSGDAGAFTFAGQNVALRLTLTRFPVEPATFQLSSNAARATHHYTINRNFTGQGFTLALDDTVTAGDRM